MSLMISPVPCLVCEKPQTINVNEVFTQLYGATSFTIDCLDGSIYDLDGFHAIICDDCITLKLLSQSIIRTAYAQDVLG